MFSRQRQHTGSSVLHATPKTADGGRWLAVIITASRRMTTTPGLLPHTVQLCVHCRQRPAGFWVSRADGQTVRRPWCLSCCQELDRDHCDVIRFDS